ncbi:unnamed protein product [Sphagnum balticum]
MIVNVDAILLKEKKKKNKLTITTSKEITKESLTRKGNLDEIAEASSILNEIGGKGVERSREKITKPLVPIVEEVEMQLIEKESMQNAPTNVDMEKGRMQEVVNDEMVIGGEDDIP